jgi:hypothetical protein
MKLPLLVLLSKQQLEPWIEEPFENVQQQISQKYTRWQLEQQRQLVLILIAEQLPVGIGHQQ